MEAICVHTGLFEEIETLAGQGVTVDASRLKLSDRAHLLFDLHKEIDGLREAELAGKQIGTTKRGIGPAYASKVIDRLIVEQRVEVFVLPQGRIPAVVLVATCTWYGT